MSLPLKVNGALMMIRDIIDQTVQEKGSKKYAVSLVKPDREDPYAIIPLDDFLELIESF